jgi:hypothetical protein
MERRAVFFTNVTLIGVDPTAGEKPMVYAAIDHSKQILALGEGSLDDVLAFAAGQRQALLAVCSPRRPNIGLMRDTEFRQKLSPPPNPGRWENARLAEYLLRSHNIHIPITPDTTEACPNWVRMGFQLYERLIEFGYKDYPDPNAKRMCMEVYPHACYSVLLGRIPFPKNSIEGRIQRQLLLYEKEVPVPDPMNIFEEITRHRLLKGILPIDNLYSAGELDALIAAYTAWCIGSSPDQTTFLGAIEEGKIALPVAEIKSRYS